jgi:hypothetical protein
MLYLNVGFKITKEEPPDRRRRMWEDAAMINRVMSFFISGVSGSARWQGLRWI